MATTEIVIWSVMLGGLLTLAGLSVADAVMNRRSSGALRNAVFVTLTGATAVMLTGMPETLVPALSGLGLGMRVLKACLGPLTAAVTLYYLGLWMGGMREDVVVHRITAWGSRVLLAAGVALALAALLLRASDFPAIFGATAIVNVAGAVLGLAACFRGAALGDPLARWMGVACLSLVLMTMGLYMHALGLPGVGTHTAVVTAALTLLFFVLASALSNLRNRETLRLRRLSNLDPGVEPASGLPTGSALVSKVEHAFWSTARYQGRCAVICVYLHNLYELSEAAGRSTEYQILVATAARIRRAAGFRCVVGAYHPRCFMVVISMNRHSEPLQATVERLRWFTAEPLTVRAADESYRRFAPRAGVGVVIVDAATASPIEVLAQAEQRAQADGQGQPEDEIITRF